MIGQSNEIIISFDRLHLLNVRVTPLQMMYYKLALQLYRSFNDYKQNDTWMSLNFQQTFNNRCETIHTINASRTRIGQNQIINRMYVLNGKIKYDWMNLTYDMYEIKCKTILLNKWNSKDRHNDDLSKWIKILLKILPNYQMWIVNYYFFNINFTLK